MGMILASTQKVPQGAIKKIRSRKIGRRKKEAS